MISENQAKRMLQELEVDLGYELTDLRKDLLRNRHPKSSLWELIVLYVSHMSYGSVVHEPEQGHPDVILPKLDMAFEACLINPPREDLEKELDIFCQWLIKNLNSSGVEFQALHTELDLLNNSVTFSVPKEHEWSGIRKSLHFSALKESLQQNGRGTLELEDNNLKIDIKISQARHSSSHGPPYTLPEKVSDHPLYNRLKRKGKQIRKWSNDILKRPIVLVIGFDGSGPEYYNGHRSGTCPISRVIFSSLLDPQKMDMLDALNNLEVELHHTNEGIELSHGQLQIKGSKYISAIVFVSVETDIGSRRHNRQPVVDMFLNEQASVPLSENQMLSLQNFDFSVVEFGPGWEGWEGTERTSLLERNLRRGGGWEMALGSETFEIEISAISLVQILSGLRSIDSVFGDMETQATSPQKLCRIALEENHPIIGVEFLAPEDQREEHKVRLKFGQPEAPLVSRSKNSGKD